MPTISVLTPENLPELQAACPDIGRIVAFLKNGDLPLDEKLARQTVFEAENYFFKEDVLYHHYQPRAKHVDEVKPLIKQVVIPVCLRQDVLREFHDNGGHNGFDRTYIMLREKWFWPSLYKDVKRVLQVLRRLPEGKDQNALQTGTVEPSPC